MSAYYVPFDQIDMIVTAAQAHAVLCGTGLTPDTFGQLLLEENKRSMIARYPSHGEEDCQPPPEAYRHVPRVPLACDPHGTRGMQLIKFVKCYQYQACEHAGWGDSEACRFTDLLIHALLERLPAYRVAAWSV